MNNYPPGAANDPCAPYNERLMLEVDVTAKSVLIKETVIETSEHHTVVEREIEPDGSYSTIAYEEPETDLRDEFQGNHRRPIEIIRDCEKIAKALLTDDKRIFAGIYLPTLVDDCQDWEEEAFEVNN